MGLDRIPKVVAIVGGPIMKKKEITLLAGESPSNGSGVHPWAIS